jgi:hypothetical protein
MSAEREYFFSGIDTDAALRFLQATKDLALYVVNVGWHVWDGRRWVIDAQDLMVLEYAQDAATEYIRLCRKLNNKTEAAAKTAASRQHILAAVYLARGYAPKTVKDLDTDPLLLNCLNGTVDLRTGQLCEHSREDYITKLAPVNFDLEARHPVLEKYLADIAAYSPDLPGYLGRCFGAALTADTSTEKLFLLGMCGLDVEFLSSPRMCHESTSKTPAAPVGIGDASAELEALSGQGANAGGVGFRRRPTGCEYKVRRSPPPDAGSLRPGRGEDCRRNPTSPSLR